MDSRRVVGVWERARPESSKIHTHTHTLKCSYVCYGKLPTGRSAVGGI